MILKFTFLGVALYLLLAVGNPSHASATSPLEVASKVYVALDELKDAYEKLIFVRDVGKALDKGEKPTVPKETDWSKYAEGYKKAAEKIETAPLPTEFDESKYNVGADELTSLRTRADALKKLNGYLVDLRAARERGNLFKVKLAKAREEIEGTQRVLKEIIDFYARLATFSGIFVFDWYTLDTHVKGELSKLSSAVNAQHTKVDKELKKLQSRISNFEANLKMLEDWARSVLSGRWTGSFAPYGEDVAIVLNFSRTGNLWTGTMSFPEEEAISLEEVRLDGAGNFNCKATTDDGDGVITIFSFTGRISDNSGEITGTVSISEDGEVDGRGPFSLRK